MNRSKHLPLLSARRVSPARWSDRGQLGTLVRLAAYSGLRSGEIVALRVGKIDFVKSTILVDQSARTASGNDGVQFGPTKTGQVRSVPMPRGIADELKTLVDGKPPDGLVFASSRG